MLPELLISPFDLSSGEITVLSIDFFDTLVTRSVAQPTHVFATLEQRLVSDGQRCYHGFARKRIQAERSARQYQQELDDRCDVTIEDIYHHLQIALGLNYKERVRLMTLEMDLEVAMCRSVPRAVALVQKARQHGVRVVVVSDNYLPSHQLLRMAEAAGVVGLVLSDIFVSCEHSGMKSNGHLWTTVLGHVGVEANQILHVGDNPEADGVQASRHGICVVVNCDMTRSHRAPFNAAPSLLSHSRLEAYVRDELCGHDWSIERVVGATTVALIIVDQIQRARAAIASTPRATVHFAARDGYLSHQVWNILKRDDSSMPEAGYLAMSRSVVWRSAINEASEKVQQKMIGNDEVLSVERLNRRLGFSLQKNGVDVDGREMVDVYGGRALIAANEQRLVESSHQLRDRLLGYLKQQGLLDIGRHFVIDLGWTGSTFADLADLVAEQSNGDSVVEGIFTALYWDATPQRTRLAMTSSAVSDFSGMWTNVMLLGLLKLLEALMTAPHGSVVNYQGAEHNFDAVFVDTEPEQRAYQTIVGPIGAYAIETALQILNNTHPSGVSGADVNGAAVWASIMQIGHDPRPEEIDQLGMICHVSAIDHEGDGEPLVLVEPPDENHGKIVSTLMHDNWWQGSLRRWQNDPLHCDMANQILQFWPEASCEWVRLLNSQ
ncbi:MAG: hypothetical protein EXQ63_03415 [Ilumatobacteraceae bacterium]|nr:hypothetical protein [Ilumatobacteraceae bacterium]